MGKRTFTCMQLFRSQMHCLYGKDQLPAKTIQEISYASMGRRCNSFTQQQNNSGRNILEKHPDSPGSLGIAISEAIEDAATHEIHIMPLEAFLTMLCSTRP